MKVEWVVNRGVDIKDGAGADIALETLLGSKFIRITNAGLRESHVHDVTITRESPNYPTRA